MRYLSLFLFLPILFSTALFAEETPKSPSVRAEMDGVYSAFQKLWEFSIEEKSFLSGQKDKEISRLLGKLDTAFHSEGLWKSHYAGEPTFRFLLKSLGSTVEDAKLRFAEGKRGYALWKVKNLSNYCITCHTRLEGVSFDFLGDEKALEKVTDPHERARYLLASRRFKRAAEEFFSIAERSKIPFERERALAQWLLVKIRVEPNPEVAKGKLLQYAKRKELTPKERSEITLWEKGLSEWIQEGGAKARTSAEVLLKKANEKEISMVDGGVIEYLRATSLLHRQLEKSLPPEMESLKLYQLAESYSALPGSFAYELPELFLERAIRLQPNTDIARQSYKLYERLMYAAYSGSGGTHLPDDVKLRMKEMENLAYGVVALTGRV